MQRKKIKPKPASARVPASVIEKIVLGVVVVLMVLFYFWTSLSCRDVVKVSTSYYYYPLLANSFMEGHTYLDVPPRPELKTLADPYDPLQNKDYRLHDASLYQDKYYLYFGPTPVVLAFLPYEMLTRDFLTEAVAVPLFCSIGFIFSVGLFLLIVRDYFPAVPLWLKVACVLSLGMADTIPAFIRRPDVYEVAIACAYALLQLALLAFYLCLRQPKRALYWLLLASTCLGAAVGARFSYLLIAGVFTVLLAWILFQGRSIKAAMMRKEWLCLVPAAIIGLLLAWYNYARFGNILEIGQRYQLAGVEMSKISFIRFDNLFYGLWFYFFSAPRFSANFPFVDHVPTFPDGFLGTPDHSYSAEKVAGIFIISPISILVLLAAMFWKRLKDPENRPMALTLIFIATSALVAAVPIVLISGATMRYFGDFAPGIIFLGCIMACHFYCDALVKPKWQRWALSSLLALLILWGCWVNLMLSFTGYYDYFRYGNPEGYTAVHALFMPLEDLFHLITPDQD